MLVIGPQETLLISPHCYLFAGNAIHSFLMVPLGRRRHPNRESGIQSGSFFFLFSRVAFFIPLGSYYSTMAELFTVDRQFDCRNKLVDKTARLSPEQGKRKKKKREFSLPVEVSRVVRQPKSKGKRIHPNALTRTLISSETASNKHSSRLSRDAAVR